MEPDMEAMMETKDRVLDWCQIEFKPKLQRKQSWVQTRKKSK